MAKHRAHTILAIGCALVGGFLIGTAAAETLQMEGTARADPLAYSASERPTRGMTQARVEATYGAPRSRSAPVGDPPISRWDYERFVVFFEYDRVIHAVLKR